MRTFFSTLVALIVVIVIVLFIGWARVPDILANNLSKKLKVYVEIGNIHLSWNAFSIKNFEIGNPAGAVQARAFQCKEIDVKAPLTHYLNKQIIIDEIDMRNVYLDLEFDSASGVQGNWSRIMSNFHNATQNQAPSSRSILIHKLILTDIDTDVVYIKEGGKIQHLRHIDRIELRDISSEGGLPMDQIMNSILGQMLRSVFQQQNLKNMLQDFMQNPPSSIDKYLNPFKGLFFNSMPSCDDYIHANT